MPARRGRCPRSGLEARHAVEIGYAPALQPVPAPSIGLAPPDIGAHRPAPWTAKTASMAMACRSRSTDRSRLTSARHKPVSVPSSGTRRATSTSILVTRTASDCEGAAARLATISRLPVATTPPSNRASMPVSATMPQPGTAADHCNPLQPNLFGGKEQDLCHAWHPTPKVLLQCVRRNSCSAPTVEDALASSR